MEQTTTTAAAPAKVNPFASAKKKETAGTKDETPVFTIAGLSQHLNSFTEAKNQIKMFDAQKKMAEGIIKEKGKEKFLELLASEGRRFTSFKLTDAGAAPVLFGLQDRYTTKLTEDDAERINAQFPNTIVAITEFKFNAELLEQYMPQIAEALMGAVPEDVLPNLLVREEKYTAKKGTIDTLATYKDQAPLLFNAIEPTAFLK